MFVRFLIAVLLTINLGGCSGEETTSTAASQASTAPETKAESPAPAAEAQPAGDAASAAPDASEAASGGASDAAAETPPSADAPSATTPDDQGIVRVEATDMMKFNTSRIEVEGTKVVIELKHTGTFPKATMGHNLVVLKPGTDPQAWANVAMMKKETEYIPVGDEAIIAHTKLIGGGESDTISFEVPGPGEYPFVCSFPGHASMMKGVLIVK